MTELESNKEFSRFFRRYLPSEIDTDKNIIFYREKYNEIINYVKLIVSNSKDLELFNYLKPKGAILINLNPGTDIIEFFKVISSNYYLEYFELDFSEIFKAPEEFFNTFGDFLNHFNVAANKKFTHPSKDNVLASSKNLEKRLVLINQKPKLKRFFHNKSILDKFINFFTEKNKKPEFIQNNTVIVWLNYDYEELVESSDQLFNIFDLFIKIPFLNSVERETFLKDFAEKNPKIVFDIMTLVKYTENWEIADLQQLLKMGIFRHYLNAELNDVSNEITDSLMNIIDSGEFVPSNISSLSEIENSTNFKQELFNIKKKVSEKTENHKDITENKNNYISQIREEGISEFMLNQLYENAASKNYSELLIIIDKLNKKELLEDHDRKLIAKYPFILNDSPNMAQINLEKAKKRIDLIKRASSK